MNVKGKIISTLLVIDTFFVSYAAGFNSRHVLIVDPALPAYVAKPEPSKSSDTDKQGTTNEGSKGGKATEKTAGGGVKEAHATGAKGSAPPGSGAGESTGVNSGSSASESRDGKKGTKSAPNAVHKPAHSAQNGTPKKADTAGQ